MPQVIGRAVHLHPVVTIFAVLVGVSAFGILGGLLGVPVAAAINVVYREFYGLPRPRRPLHRRRLRRLRRLQPDPPGPPPPEPDAAGV